MSYKVKGYVNVRNATESIKSSFTARADTIETFTHAQAAKAFLTVFSKLEEIGGDECKVTFYICDDGKDDTEELSLEWGKIEKRKV